ncbi:MAG: hypothetical protein LBM96_04965 [Methanobrevibacter sp.]|nr:hypothetical protein [Candidatus Methanoflexus mossambicus]
MIISSSRKPADNTRIFCKNLSNTFGFKYISRGKSSLRDLGLKSEELGFKYLCLIYELKGMPSKLSIFTNDGKEKFSLKIDAKTTSNRLHIKPKELKYKSIPKGLEFLNKYFDFDFDEKGFDNLIEINSSKDPEEIAIINFINDKGSKSEFEIKILDILYLDD